MRVRELNLGMENNSVDYVKNKIHWKKKGNQRIKGRMKNYGNKRGFITERR